MQKIESASNPKIKLAAGLAKRSQREKTGLFVAEGVRLAEMAAASDWDIAFALVTERAADEDRVQTILARLEARETKVFLVPELVYAKASGTESPQGVLLVVRQKRWALDDLCGNSPCYLVLDRVQDPGNLGTILRTADAAGMDGVILLKGTVDAFSPKVVRAAMGSLFHVPVVADVTEDAFLAFAEARGLKVFATALDATARPHFAASFRGASAIVFGNEGAGVSERLLAHAERIYIPMYGGAESLNVAVSSAIVLYEVVRQRHALSD
ncbi:RNA methyltransferase [Selenomonas sp.]|uniref:TrmH family RNA methyltransferase n=1 Tax=Selenomonas sp. TaxID=2053611 RepID=UPI0025DD92B9|nr:RNA methyltransferase [Selenomonas sp.]MCI6284963.1 RNA methyltransferase [Selenomonas sp.]